MFSGISSTQKPCGIAVERSNRKYQNNVCIKNITEIISRFIALKHSKHSGQTFHNKIIKQAVSADISY